MTKAISDTEVNANAFYDLLQQQGVKDEQLDTSVPAEAGQKPEVDSREVFAFVFKNFAQYGDQVREHFKKLGLNLDYLNADGSLSKEKSEAILKKLAGKGPESLSSQVEKKVKLPKPPKAPEKDADQEAIAKYETDLAKYREAFQKAQIKIVQAAWKTPEFRLLSVADQEKALVAYYGELGFEADHLKDLTKDLKRQLVAINQGNTLEKKVGYVASLEGQRLFDNGIRETRAGNSEVGEQLLLEAQALLQAAVEVDPNQGSAQWRLAMILSSQGKLDEAKKHLVFGIRSVSDRDELEQIHGCLQMPEFAKVMGEEKHSWGLIADQLFTSGLSERGRMELAMWAYQKAHLQAFDAGDPAAAETYNQRWLGADELWQPYGFDFVDARSGRLSNRAAANLYQALAQAGVYAHEMDQEVEGKRDRNLSTAEIYDFVSQHLDDARVQKVLEQNEISLSEEDKKKIREQGFGKFMAGQCTDEAAKLKEKDAETNAEKIGELLLISCDFDPDNAERHEAVGDFFSEQGNTALALDTYASALDLDKENGEIKDKLLKTYDQLVNEGWDLIAKAEGAPGDAAKAEAAEKATRGMIAAYDRVSKVLPEKFAGTDKEAEMGDLKLRLGKSLAAQGKQEEAHQLLTEANGHFQSYIDHNKNNPKCIGIYKSMAEVHHELGDYLGANRMLMKASQCKKLMVHVPEGGEAPDIHSIKQDRTPGEDGTLPVPIGEGDIQSFNYIPSEAHDIESASGLDRIPYWADQGIREYDQKLEGMLEASTAERKKLEEAVPPQLEKLYEALSQESKLLKFFDRTDEAKALADRAMKLKEEITVQRLTKAVESGVTSGRIDQEALFFSKYEEGGGKKLEYYAAVRYEGGKPHLELKETFYALKPSRQQNILKALLKAGQRMDVVKGMRQAKGPLKTFFRAQLDLVDGNRAEAKEKLGQFVQDAKGSKDPKVQPFLREAERLLANLKQAEGKDQAQLMGEMRHLLGPLVISLNRGSDGSLDLSKISKDEVKSFEDFRNYLTTQVSVDSVSFNASWAGATEEWIRERVGASVDPVLFANYEKVMGNPRHEALLRQLYAEFNPEAAKDLPKVSSEKLQEMLIDFQKDLVGVSYKNFVSNQIGTKQGRDRLRAILRDPLHYDVAFRADLLEELIDVADSKGFVPQHLRAQFERQISTFGYDYEVTQEEIAKATQVGLKILTIADHKEGAHSLHVEKYERYPNEVKRLQSDKLKREVTPQRIKAMAELVRDRGDQTDNLSLMEAHLGNFWLTLIDEKNWSPEFNKQFVSDDKRAEMVNRVEAFMAEAKDIKTDQQFLEWSMRIRRYLRGSGSGEEGDLVTHVGNVYGFFYGEDAGKEYQSVAESVVSTTLGVVSDTPASMLSGMVPMVGSSFTDLLRFSDEMWAADNMGQQVQAFDPQVALTDPAQKKMAVKLIQDLREVQRSWSYQYKQRNLLSRGVSQIGRVGDYSDVTDIQRGSREVEDIIGLLERAQTQGDLEKVKARLTKATAAGGAIFQAFAGSEMEGSEQMINFVEIIGEIVLITALTRGGGTEAAFARGVRAMEQMAELGRGASRLQRLRASYDVWRAGRALRLAQGSERAEVAKEALESLGQKASPFRGLGSRLARSLEGEVGVEVKWQRGFGLGSAITTTQNVTGLLSNQLKTEPETLTDWLIQAMATGGSMVLSGTFAAEAVGHAQQNILGAVRERFFAQGAKGALHFLADTGLEVIEEVADNYIANFLHGNVKGMSWDEMKDIIIVCMSGGGMKMGAVAEFVGRGVRDVRYSKMIKGFETRGEKVVYDAQHGNYVLASQDGKYIKKVDKGALKNYINWSAANNPEGEMPPIEVVRFEKAKKGADAEVLHRALPDLPALHKKSTVEEKAPQEPGLVKTGRSAETNKKITNGEALRKGREVLGLPATGELDAGQIKSAHREWVGQHHPDFQGLDTKSPEYYQANRALNQANALTLILLREEAGVELTHAEKDLADSYLAGKIELPAETKSAKKVQVPRPDTSPEGREKVRRFQEGKRAREAGPQVPRPEVRPAAELSAIAAKRRAKIETIQARYAAGDKVVQLNGKSQYLPAGSTEPTRAATRDEVVAYEEWNAPVWLDVRGAPVLDKRARPVTVDFKRGRKASVGRKGTLSLAGDGIEAIHAKIERQVQNGKVRFVLHRSKGADGKPNMVRIWNEAKNAWVPVNPIYGAVLKAGDVLWVGSTRAKVPVLADWEAGQVDLGEHMPHGQVFGFAPRYADVKADQLPTAAEAAEVHEAGETTTGEMAGGEQQSEGQEQAPADADKTVPGLRVIEGGRAESLNAVLHFQELGLSDLAHALAEGHLDTAVAKALSDTLNAVDNVAELESHLGIPPGEWAEKLNAHPQEAAARLKQIRQTRETVGEIIQGVLSGKNFDRQSLKIRLMGRLKADGLELSSDTEKAIDSIIDVANTANYHRVIDARDGEPGALTHSQLTSMLTTLYLKPADPKVFPNSPGVRIGSAELTHVPLVVKGTVEIYRDLMGFEPTPSQMRVIFLMALLHDAGKFEFNLRTTKGVTIQATSPLNHTGVDIPVEPNETLPEAIARITGPLGFVKDSKENKILTAIQKKQGLEGLEAAAEHLKELPLVKKAPFLVGVIAHHDSANVNQYLQQLIGQGIIKDMEEGGEVGQAIYKHGLVSSWILNNSEGGLGIYSHAFDGFEDFRELYVGTKEKPGVANRVQNNDPADLVDLSKESQDEQLNKLREMFDSGELFPPEVRALLLGDHQGQVDLAKVLTILSGVYKNPVVRDGETIIEPKDVKIWHLFQAPDERIKMTHGAEGYFLTHSAEQRILDPNIGEESAKAFAAGLTYLNVSNGLAEALDPGKSPQEVQAWLASQDLFLKDENGQLKRDEKGQLVFNPLFGEIQQKIESHFYQYYAINKTKSDFEWATRPRRPDLPAEMTTKERAALYHLAEGDTPYGIPAERLMRGEINLEEYQRELSEISEKIVREHEPALETVNSILGQLETDPELNVRSVKSRSKSPEAIPGKLVNRGWYHMAPFTDFVGARVIFDSFFNGDQFSTTAFIAKLKESVAGQDIRIRALYDAEGKPITNESNIAIRDWDAMGRYLTGHPKRGHRSIHLVVEVNGKPVEIQMMTRLQAKWAEIQHEFYKNREGLTQQEISSIDEFFKKAADFIHHKEINAKLSEDAFPDIPILRPEVEERFQKLLDRTVGLLFGEIPKEEHPRYLNAARSEALARFIQYQDQDATPVEGTPGPHLRSLESQPPPSSRTEGPRVEEFVDYVQGRESNRQAKKALEAFFAHHHGEYPAEKREELLEEVQQGRMVFYLDPRGVARLLNAEQLEKRSTWVRDFLSRREHPVFKLLSEADWKSLEGGNRALERLLVRASLQQPTLEGDVLAETRAQLDHVAQLLTTAQDLPRNLKVEILLRVLAGQRTAGEIGQMLKSLDSLQENFGEMGLDKPREAFARYYRTNPFQGGSGRAPLDSLQEFLMSRQGFARLAEPILKRLSPEERTSFLGESDFFNLTLDQAIHRAVEFTVGRALADARETDRIVVERIWRKLEEMGEVDRKDFETWKARNQLLALLDGFQKKITKAQGEVQSSIAFTDAALRHSEPAAMFSSLREVASHLRILSSYPGWNPEKVARLRNQVQEIQYNIRRTLQDPVAAPELKARVLERVQNGLRDVRKGLEELSGEGPSFMLMELSEFAFDERVSGEKLLDLGEALQGLSALEQTDLLYDFLMDYQGLRETATTDKKESKAEAITRPDVGDTRRDGGPPPPDADATKVEGAPAPTPTPVDETAVDVPKPAQAMDQTPSQVTPVGLLDGTIAKALALKPVGLNEPKVRARDATRINPMASARDVSAHVVKGGLTALVGMETLSASPRVAHAADPASPNAFPISEAMSFTECLQNLFFATVDWVGAHPGVTLFGMAMTAALAAAGRFRGAIRSQLEAYLEREVVKELEGPKEQVATSEPSPAEEIAPILAQMEAWEPAFQGHLKIDDFKRVEVSYLTSGYRYELKPSPGRAQVLMKILMEAHADHFPELDIHLGLSKEETLSRLREFLPNFKYGDSRIYGGDRMHCGASTAALVYLLRLKGFEAFDVSMERRYTPSMSLDLNYTEGNEEAVIADHGKILKKFSEAVGLSPGAAKSMALYVLEEGMSQEDMQRVAEEEGFSLEQVQKAYQVYSQMSEADRELLEDHGGWGHVVAGVLIDGEYYLIDINGEQYGGKYAGVAFISESEAIEKGFILSAPLEEDHRNISFNRYRMDLSPPIEENQIKIRNILESRGILPSTKTETASEGQAQEAQAEESPAPKTYSRRLTDFQKEQQRRMGDDWFVGRGDEVDYEGTVSEAVPSEAPKTKLSPLERLQTLAAKDPELANDPVKLVNRYLTGQLDGEPRLSEVRELGELLRKKWDIEDLMNAVADPTVGPAVFQIYTKEFLDAMATYVLRLVDEFRETHGREPVIMEIAAGDGRLSAGLNRRLVSKGLRIQPTDLGMDNKWEISFGKEVIKKDARQVAEEADIILGSWLPFDKDFDVEVAQRVAQDPKKTLILIGEGGLGATGSTAFWDYVSPSNGNVREGFLDGLNYTSDDEHLPTSRQVFTERGGRDITGVTVYRSPEAPKIPDLAPEEVLSDWGISSPKTLEEEVTAPGVIPREARTQSNLPPQGAAYAVGAPVAMFVTLTSQGVNTGLALLAAAASAVFSSPAILGIFSGLFKGKEPLSEPQYFSPPAGKNSFTLGRHPSNDIQIDPKDKNVSRVHATVQLGPDGKWYIWDGGENPSGNGVFIQSGGLGNPETKLEPNQWHLLQDGDVLRMGRHRLHFEAQSAVAPAAPVREFPPDREVVATNGQRFWVETDSRTAAFEGNKFYAAIQSITKRGPTKVLLEVKTRDGMFLQFWVEPQWVEKLNPLFDANGVFIPGSVGEILMASLDSETKLASRDAARLEALNRSPKATPSEPVTPVEVPKVRAPEPVTPAEIPLEKTAEIYLDKVSGLIGKDWHTTFDRFQNRVQFDPQWLDREINFGGAAATANMGFQNKYQWNEDRVDFISFPDGRTLAIAIDGVGGHGGGERASSLAQAVIRMAALDGRTPEEAIQLADHAIHLDNKARQKTGGQGLPGATLAIVEMIPQDNGTYRGNFFNVADSDALVIRPGLAAQAGQDPVVEMTERLHLGLMTDPNGQAALRPDGKRLKRGRAYLNRQLFAFKNIIFTQLGAGKVEIDSFQSEQEFHAGDVVIVGSDGLHETFIGEDVINRIVMETIRRTGRTKAQDIMKALKQESLIRMWMYKYLEPGHEIRHEDYLRAYREVLGQEAPTDYRGMYEPKHDAAGKATTYKIEEEGEIYEYHPDKFYGSKVDQFGMDNLSIVVQVVGEEVGPPRPDWPPVPQEFSLTPAHMRYLHSLPAKSMAREMLEDPQHLGIAPVTMAQADGYTFFMSRAINVQERDGGFRTYVLALVPVQENGRVVLKRRYFYKSGSDAGAWRATPGMIMGRLEKIDQVHYTQATKPALAILARLKQLESAHNQPPLSSITLKEEQVLPYLQVIGEKVTASGWGTQIGKALEEIQKVPGQGMTQVGAYQPGKAFHSRRVDYREKAEFNPNLLQTFSEFSFPEGFVPDFSEDKVKAKFELYSSEQGMITCREYGGASIVDKNSGQRRPVIWTMAEDASGRTWVYGVRYADSKTNSYGVYHDVLDTGILTQKPLEYTQQATHLTGFLNRLVKDEVYQRYHRETDRLTAMNIPYDDIALSQRITAEVLKEWEGFVQQFKERFPDGLAKPYLDQNGVPSSDYVDVTPMLYLLKPIQDYRRARKLPLPEGDKPLPSRPKAGSATPAPAPAMETSHPRIPGLRGGNGLWVYHPPRDLNEVILGRDFSDEEGVSARHARIYQKGGRYWIQDLVSLNGTYMLRPGEGKKAVQIKRVTPLQNGDEIYIGGQRIIVELDN